jgi:hypothetical protein
MNRAAVAQLVLESAARFGDGNPQQFRFLVSRFSKDDPLEVLSGLIQVFTVGPAAPEGSDAQELAGALLTHLKPRGEIQLESVIRAALPRYELSVEQFPQFLAATAGTDKVLQVLNGLDSADLSTQEARARDTMLYWLQGHKAIQPASE